ncbi:MAG TPA: hypothetical protein VF233_12950, partial [Nitrososphaeraceae archaeon]
MSIYAIKLADSEAFMKRFYDHSDKVERDEKDNKLREQEIILCFQIRVRSLYFQYLFSLFIFHN